MQKIHVHAVCNAKRFRIKASVSGLKVWLCAQPEKGRANEELLEGLKSAFGCPVLLLTGSKSRNKEIGVQCTQTEFEEKLQKLA